MVSQFHQGASIVRWYVVYRQGLESIGNEQQGLEKVAVARLRARSEEDACRKAAEVMLGGNQCLSAEPAEDVDAKESALNLPA